jgi:predicted esterase
VPQDNAERLASMLRQFGADVTLRWQNIGHGLENEEIIAAQTWLSHLKLNS